MEFNVLQEACKNLAKFYIPKNLESSFSRLKTTEKDTKTLYKTSANKEDYISTPIVYFANFVTAGPQVGMKKEEGKTTKIKTENLEKVDFFSRLN